MMRAAVVFTLMLIASATPNKKFRISSSQGSVFFKAVNTAELSNQDLDSEEDIVSINQKVPGGFLIEGDMLGNKNSRSSIIDTNKFWTSTTIPISYSKSLNLLAIAGIEDSRVEYEMRTCFTFPYRQNEKNYLFFDPQGGCWSSVGMQDGGQTVSIGPGCEGKSTVIHEMMHAIGVYHQQSRTDRDGYISIETDNIDPDLVYNFDKYTYDFVDDRRVAYDFDSVMHYGETAFSNNGEKTILTKDPQFQGNIGQRRTFSEGDVETINRMYNCAGPLRHSFSCNFEENSVCGFVQETGDDVDWLRHVVGESDDSSISNNLPATDSSSGIEGKGSYMLFNSSNLILGQKARLNSMRLKSVSSQQCLQFKYYMNLEAGSSAVINVLLAEIDSRYGDITSTSPLLTVSGDKGAYWNTERLTISAQSQYKLLFEVVSSGLANEVIAIDDINVLDQPCETNFFTVHDFSELLASTQKGNYFYGPLQYTDDGYAYRLIIYPHGISSATTGYISVYLALAQGTEDDNLVWPFHDQVIRLSVVDQNPHFLVRMDQHLSYITGSNGGSAWEKPTSSLNSGYGYANFMRLDDILNSRNFIVNDAVVFSTNIKNMANFRQNHASAFADPHPADPVMVYPRFHNHDFENYPCHDHENHHGHGNQHENENDLNSSPEDDDLEDDDVEDVVSPSLVAGIAFACSFAIFIFMSLIIVCVNQTHKQAMTAITIANHSARTTSCHANPQYEQEKI